LRWVRDVCSDSRPAHRVLLFALTVDGLELEPARGAVRDCLQRLRVPHPGLRYLWWAEFQRRGAIHYHGMLVDPPFQFERQARAWFSRHWPLARIQTWVEWRSGAWLRSGAGAYALKDVRKVAGKRYEQEYGRMPRGWRTFSCHRLAFTPEEHRPHENRSYVAVAPDVGGVVLWAQDIHVAASGGCLVKRNDAVRRRRRVLRPGRSHGKVALPWRRARDRGGGTSTRLIS